MFVAMFNVMVYRSASETCCSGMYPTSFSSGDPTCPAITADFPPLWSTSNVNAACTAPTPCQVMSCIGTYIPIGTATGTTIQYFQGGCYASITAALGVVNNPKNALWWAAHYQLYSFKCVAANVSSPTLISATSTTGQVVDAQIAF